MKIEGFSFGRIRIDGKKYEYDVVIDRGSIAKREKKPSKAFTEQFGHTPLSIREDLPWNCLRLVIGTGAYGSLPVMDEVTREAKDRHVELVVLPTPEAIAKLNESNAETNAVLHVTC
ncbi:MAG TPA: MTH938/NDUFAF3 family protein [Candidatus Cybelea sp.]|jgi:hypothetical protein